MQCRVFVHLCALVAGSSLRHPLRVFRLSASGFAGPSARSSDHRRLEYPAQCWLVVYSRRVVHGAMPRIRRDPGQYNLRDSGGKPPPSG